MIEANLYRSRIGTFQQVMKIRIVRGNGTGRAKLSKSVRLSAVLIITFIISLLTISSLPQGTGAGRKLNSDTGGNSDRSSQNLDIRRNSEIRCQNSVINWNSDIRTGMRRHFCGWS